MRRQARWLYGWNWLLIKSDHCVAELTKSVALMKDPVIKVENLIVDKEDPMFNLEDQEVKKKGIMFNMEQLIDGKYTLNVGTKMPAAWLRNSFIFSMLVLLFALQNTGFF